MNSGQLISNAISGKHYLMGSSITLQPTYLRPIVIKKHSIHIGRNACFPFFCFLGCGKSMNGIKLLISNLKRKKGWGYSKHSLDFRDYLLICLRVPSKDFDSCNWDYGTRSLLAFLMAKDRSVETLKILYCSRWFSPQGKECNSGLW